MRNLLTAAVALVLLSAAQSVSAQEIRGFAFGSTTSDLNDQQFPGFGGGVTVNLGQPWLAAGAQGEAFTSWPYFGGRGAVFAEGRPFPKAAVQPLVIGGVGFGEDAGPMVGGGLEIRPANGRVGFRITVEDYISLSRTYNTFGGPIRSQTGHQIATRFGVTF